MRDWPLVEFNVRATFSSAIEGPIVLWEATILNVRLDLVDQIGLFLENNWRFQRMSMVIICVSL